MRNSRAVWRYRELTLRLWRHKCGQCDRCPFCGLFWGLWRYVWRKGVVPNLSNKKKKELDTKKNTTQQNKTKYFLNKISSKQNIFYLPDNPFSVMTRSGLNLRMLFTKFMTYSSSCFKTYFPVNKFFSGYLAIDKNINLKSKNKMRNKKKRESINWMTLWPQNLSKPSIKRQPKQKKKRESIEWHCNHKTCQNRQSNVKQTKIQSTINWDL